MCPLGHPLDCLLRWPWIWECQWPVDLILVANWLKHSIFSSSMWVASSACQWASLALVRAWLQESSSPPVPSEGTVLDAWTSRCLLDPILVLPLAGQNPTFVTVTLLKRCRFPGPIPQFILGCTVEGLVTFSIDKHHYRVPRFCL